MKTITIKQPWASLIRDGIKKYEFRTWKTSYRGKIYIHAGLGEDKEAIKRLNMNIDYPKGYIIAEAEIIDCIEVDESFKKKLKEENENIYQGAINHRGKNEYAFVLDNIKIIKPIPAKGKLSFWEYKKD